MLVLLSKGTGVLVLLSKGTRVLALLSKGTGVLVDGSGASAESRRCTGIMDALPTITASISSNNGKSEGTSDSSSDSRPVPLLLSQSTICLYFVCSNFTFA